MTRVHASIDTLEALRQALERFAYAEEAVLARARDEIALTIGLLEQAERRRRWDIEQCQRALEICRHEAARAAPEGYGWDCSRETWALQEAEERLATLLKWRERVEQQAAEYHRAAQHFTHFLDFDLPRTFLFLDRRIQALERYHAHLVPPTGL